MITRLAGALVRALFVVLLITTPALLLPEISVDSIQMMMLVAIFGAALTIFEYSSTYPGLVEFREAPPFNRIRFFTLFATVLLLSALMRGQTDPTTATEVVTEVGRLIAAAIDFPFSPVWLVMTMLPSDASARQIDLMRTAAGISYLSSLVALAVFLIVLRLRGWPSRLGAFNVWINLPTFEPTAQGDVVERLERDARINIALGFLLPFLIPVAVKAAGSLFGAVSLASPLSMIWTVAAWAFLPASLFMRGIAMGRIARMIAYQRRSAEKRAETDGVVTV